MTMLQLMTMLKRMFSKSLRKVQMDIRSKTVHNPIVGYSSASVLSLYSPSLHNLISSNCDSEAMDQKVLLGSAKARFFGSSQWVVAQALMSGFPVGTFFKNGFRV